MASETAISKAITKLSEVESKFNLSHSNDPQFFTEWQRDVAELSENVRFFEL